MRELFSFIFDMITDPLTLPISPLYEWMILAVISVVACKIAFRAVGELYDFGLIDGSFLGSLLHWIIRFIAFAVIWAVVYCLIVFGQWVAAHWVLTLCVVCGMMLLSIGSYFLIRHFKQEAHA